MVGARHCSDNRWCSGCPTAQVAKRDAACSSQCRPGPPTTHLERPGTLLAQVAAVPLQLLLARALLAVELGDLVQGAAFLAEAVRQAPDVHPLRQVVLRGWSAGPASAMARQHGGTAATGLRWWCSTMSGSRRARASCEASASPPCTPSRAGSRGAACGGAAAAAVGPVLGLFPVPGRLRGGQAARTGASWAAGLLAHLLRSCWQPSTRQSLLPAAPFEPGMMAAGMVCCERCARAAGAMNSLDLQHRVIITPAPQQASPRPRTGQRARA